MAKAPNKTKSNSKKSQYQETEDHAPELLAGQHQWSIKHRPSKLEDVVTDSDLSVLEGLMTRSQAILLTGPSGSGKTTIARIIANELQGTTSSINRIEVNAAEASGIDEIRALQDRLRFSPTDSYHVVIYDEAHRSSAAASSAFLKLLEDPPHRKVVFILCTDQPWRLPRPLVNRCRSFDIKPPSINGCAKLLYKIANKEGFKHKSLKQICKFVAQEANAIPRLALQLMQNVVESKGDLGDLKSIKATVSQSRDDSDQIAGSILIALYSTDKPVDKRVSYIQDVLRNCDIYGVIMRLISANYYGTQMLNDMAFDWRGKTGKEALSSKNIVPSWEDSTRVAKVLIKARQEMVEPATSPEVILGVHLADLCATMTEPKPDGKTSKPKKKK